MGIMSIIFPDFNINTIILDNYINIKKIHNCFMKFIRLIPQRFCLPYFWFSNNGYFNFRIDVKCNVTRFSNIS